MDWDHDVCLECGRQTAEGEKFCTQQCRLLDLERAGHGHRLSEPATPTNLPTFAPAWMSWQMTNSTNPTYLTLVSPVNFSAYKQNPNTESPSSSPKTRSPLPPRQQPTSSYNMSQPVSTTAYAQTSQRVLMSSSSRSSLASVSSSSTWNTTSISGLSESAMNQLKEYSGAFDTVRAWKRRVTYS